MWGPPPPCKPDEGRRRAPASAFGTLNHGCDATVNVRTQEAIEVTQEAIETQPRLRREPRGTPTHRGVSRRPRRAGPAQQGPARAPTYRRTKDGQSRSREKNRVVEQTGRGEHFCGSLESGNYDCLLRGAARITGTWGRDSFQLEPAPTRTLHHE